MSAFTKKTTKKTTEAPKIIAPHYVVRGDQVKLVGHRDIARNEEDLGAVPSAVYRQMGRKKNGPMDRDSDLGCPHCYGVFIRSCLEHPLFWVPNKVDRRIKSDLYSHRTVPTNFCRVSDEGAKGNGIRAVRDIPTGLVFGPYEGIKTDADKCENPDYSWDIVLGKKTIAVDGKNKGNWLSLVNSPDYARGANLIVFQHKGEMYYLVKKPIKEGQELLVWYGEKFGRRLARYRKQAEQRQQ